MWEASRKRQPRAFAKRRWGLGVVLREEHHRHRGLEMRKESVDPVRPEGAVAAALPHVVDGEKLAVPREELAEAHLARERPEGVVPGLPGRRRPAAPR